MTRIRCALFASCVVLEACGSGGSSAPAPAPTPTPTPSVSAAPAVVTSFASPMPLPAQGALVEFPVADGATGAWKMPYFTTSAGTSVELSTMFGGGGSLTVQARKHRAASTGAVTLMSLGVNVSADVVLSTLPVTVFTLPPSSAPFEALTLEVFDELTQALVIAEPQGSAPDGDLIAFSENLDDETSQNVAITLKAGHTYQFALVQNSGLKLPAGGAPCGYPPPIPFAPFDLAYPEPAATGVPTTAGELVFQGFPGSYFGPRTVSVTAGTAAIVNAVAVPESPAPSPLPTPFAAPQGSSAPFEAVPLPELSPQTLYAVSSTYDDFGDTPPACTMPVTQMLGSFTTGS